MPGGRRADVRILRVPSCRRVLPAGSGRSSRSAHLGLAMQAPPPSPRSLGGPCAAILSTKPWCRPTPSSFSAQLLVVEPRVVVDLSEQIDDLQLLTTLDVLLQGFIDCCLFRVLVADLQRFLQQTVIDSQIRSHSEHFTQRNV